MADNAGLDQIISDQITTFLQDPQGLPEEFLQWLPQFLSVNSPSISAKDIQGGSFTPVDGSQHSVDWGTGTLHFSASQTATDTQQHGLGDVPSFLVAFPSIGGCAVGGTGDAAQVTINGWLSSPTTVDVPYFWLAIV